jgi:hypothetical protein
MECTVTELATGESETAAYADQARDSLTPATRATAAATLLIMMDLALGVGVGMLSSSAISEASQAASST